MACSWSGDRRSKIPSGSSNTGLKIPKTPGSKGTGEDSALTGMSNDKGDAARTADRIFLHRANHAKRTAVKPQTQIASKLSGARLATEGTAKCGAVADGAKGWLISSIATGNGDCAIDAAVRHSN
jgi:hypothetical protein